MADLLYSEVNGSGQNVVLLHGWGMHGGFWGRFNKLLLKSYQTHVIDLPGYGFSKDSECDFSLDAYSAAIEKYIHQLPQPVILIGWSLGGLIALNILKRKNAILVKVILLATTPCFTKKSDWTCAIEQSIFDDFAKELQQDYKKTLKRFLSLQTRGSDLSRDELREINKILHSRGEPKLKALEQGLNILRETDLRKIIQNELAALVILGEKDTLVPMLVMNEFNKIFSNLKTVVIKKAAHAPFISHPEICAKEIKNFINEQ